MKKIFTLAAALMLTTAAFAQEAIWGVNSLISPEVHPDNTVTFRFKAPKAVRVQVVGDFIKERNADGYRIADLKEGDKGIWEFTTGKLDSELYSYRFIVDGLQVTDPLNVYMNRDVNNVDNIFIVKGGKGDLYSVNDVPHGTVSKVWYDIRHSE